MPDTEPTVETTPAKEILAILVNLTKTLDHVGVELEGIRLELRKANQLDVEKMRFNQFMDTMRSEYVKLAKRLAKEALHANPGEKAGKPRD